MCSSDIKGYVLLIRFALEKTGIVESGDQLGYVSQLKQVLLPPELSEQQTAYQDSEYQSLSGSPRFFRSGPDPHRLNESVSEKDLKCCIPEW